MLDNKDLIILTAAFYLGSVVATFFKAITSGLITPILAPAAAAGKGVSSLTVQVGSAKLLVGEVIEALVNLILSFVIVVFTIGLLRTYVLSKIGAARGGKLPEY
jgi:large-conductance mechanosensitive channel